MRLLSHEVDGHERLAVALGSEHAVDVATLLDDGPWTMARLLEDISGSLARLRRALEGKVDSAATRFDSLLLLPPVPRPRMIVAVGRNYREHAAEESAELPAAPLLFAKLPSAVAAHGATITWSAGLTGQVDYEAELAVVIGRRARNVSVGQALDHVLGYTCLNDVSARDLQVRDGQWTRAKSLAPFGGL